MFTPLERLSTSNTNFTSASLCGSATLSGQAAVACGAGSLAINGGPITQVQDGLGSVGWTPAGVGNGAATGAPCSNPHCMGLYDAVTTRHIQTDPLVPTISRGGTKSLKVTALRA